MLFGVSLYAGIFHLLFFINRKENRENLYFALICFSIAFYDVMCFGLYNANSVMTGIVWLKGQYFAVCFLIIAFFYFVFALMERKRTWPSRIMIAVICFLLAAGALFPNLIWNLQAPRIKNITVFGLQITYFEARSAVLMNVLFALTISAAVYIFYILLKSYLRQGRKDLLPLLIGVIVYFVSTILDVLIAGSIVRFVYTSEYAFIVLIFMMDFSFQKRFVQLFRDVETMNVKLEDRVKERTNDINDLLLELSVANKELEEKNEILQELSERDSLTKLLNHAAFLDRLAEIFNAAQRHHFPLAVIMIDIDHFKRINDQFGHPVGDRIIKKVAEMLLNTSRKYDVKARFGMERTEVPLPSIRKYDIAGRYGGDEFSVILPYCDDKETRVVSERIRKHINDIVLEDQPDLHVSASMGGVVYDRSVAGDDEGRLILQADQALYEAKKSGRNQVVINRFAGRAN